jgi:hypothetical protein
MKKLIPPMLAITSSGTFTAPALRDLARWCVEVTDVINKSSNPDRKIDPEESYNAYTGRRPMFPVDEDKKTAKKSDKKSDK